MGNSMVINHRQAFAGQMKEASFALFFSGVAPHKSGDQKYPYVPNRNFYYLTGLTRENFILLLGKSGDRLFDFLFIEEASDYATKWLGSRMTREEASVLSGIAVERIRFLGDFPGFLNDAILSDSRKALMAMPKALYLDLYRDQPLGRPSSLDETQSIRDNYPELKIKNANEILDRLRMVKDDAEIREIESAIILAKALKPFFPSQDPAPMSTNSMLYLTIRSAFAVVREYHSIRLSPAEKMRQFSIMKRIIRR